MESRDGIADVFKRERIIEGVEDFLEEVDTVGDSRVKSRRYCLRRGVGGHEMTGHGAPEVCPIYCPGVVVRACIGVGDTRRQDEILVGAHIVCRAAKFEPSATVDTVYKYILRDWRVAVPVVVRCLGVVADVGDMEEACEWVFLHAVDNHSG